MIKNKWIKFLILYIGATVLSLSQLKIVPIFNELSSTMNISMSQTSLLTSIFTFSALFLAIPGGGILNKFGVKKVSVFIMVCLFLGNILGAISNSFSLLLISRVIEGISFSMIMMVSMIYINFWFRDGSAGLAIGIFGTFSALASMIGMNIFRPIYLSTGLKSIWYIMAIASFIIILCYYFLLDGPEESDSNTEEKGGLREAASNKSTWLLAFAMGCMSFVLFTFITVYPQIFTQVYHLSPDKSNYFTSLFGLFAVPFGVIAGLVTDKTGKPVALTLISYIVLSVACFLTVRLTNSILIGQVFFASACLSLVSSSISIAVNKMVKRPSLIGSTFSIIYLFYYIGIFIGSPIVSKVVEVSGWNAGTLLLTVVSLLGTASIAYLSFSKKLTKSKSV
ncbi:MFS transporter [Metaclostridioides mangenotii]|uniref:MFS family arabinose efflux permease n=1 Tax=Metaclostridioides mangenotii TaxID=1540 RepID=A0ABS4EDJ5_9FIRM|nr:MFS transporter [Clostridioides mangenotii]MBP1855951.1 putative MFS family arabinose efflux permease [Clostridioides mangenotii]